MRPAAGSQGERLEAVDSWARIPSRLRLQGLGLEVSFNFCWSLAAVSILLQAGHRMVTSRLDVFLAGSLPVPRRVP